MSRKPAFFQPQISPDTPLDLTRTLREISNQVNLLHNRLTDQENTVNGKLGKSPTDMGSLVEFVRSKLQATGSHPLSIAGLPGLTAQAQKALAPTVSASGAAVEGQLAIINGVLSVYRSRAWVPVTGITGGGAVVDTHDSRTGYTPTQYANGSFYFETDRTSLYVNVDSTWTYAAGTMLAAAAAIPTDLSTPDIGFSFFSTDTQQQSFWTGSAWLSLAAFWG